jgi:TolB-like protein
VAVLYLDDYSPHGELGYLANGLTEMLIHDLAQVDGLDVLSRNGVKPYRDRAVPLDSLAAALRAGTLVEGSVQRSGDSVRVTVQLIDTNTQAHLESRSIVRPLDPRHLFALQDAVAGEVSAALRRRVGREVRLSALRRQAHDPRALDLVLRAWQARADAAELARSSHPRDVESALDVLALGDSLATRAAALDPRWNEPVLLRGWLAVDGGRLARGGAQLDAYGQALARADDVLRRDSASDDARELRGTALWLTVIAAPGDDAARARLSAAERDLRAVVAADPGRATAWATLGQLLRVGGDLAEAELAARKSHDADAYLDVPDVGDSRLYRAALALGDYPRARHWCDDGRARFPRDYRFVECALVLLARDPAAPARPDSAWRLLGLADGVDPPATATAAARPYSPVFRRMMVAAVLARAGLGDSARAVAGRARRWVEDDPDQRTSFLWDDAYVQLLLGDRARAAAQLDTFVAHRPELRAYVARETAFRGLVRP